MKHIVSVMGAVASDQRVGWFCRCGAGRESLDISQAGSEALIHLRFVEEGLEFD